MDNSLEKYPNGICLINTKNLKIYIFSNKLPSNLITKEENVFPLKISVSESIININMDVYIF